MINESGSYVSDPDGLKSYMYDFFLQIDLASVNRKKNFNLDGEDDDEEGKDGDEGLMYQSMKNAPSFINTHLGASFAGNNPAEIQH